MNKNRANNIRKPHDPVRIMAIKNTAVVFNVTTDYVRSCVRCDAAYGQADDIRKRYNIEYEKIKSVYIT